MTISCAIVDDEELARARIRRLLARARDFTIAAELADPRRALAELPSLRPDLLFLDVQMPELDGFELLAGLPRDRLPAVIFVTAHDGYALRAFEQHALDYLQKPFTAARFHDALEHARARLTAPADPQAAALRRLLASVDDSRAGRIAVRGADGVTLLRHDEIDWIEAADNYAQLHAGARSYLVREPMAALEQRLDERRFARIHRGVIVNLDRIRELKPLFAGDWQVILETGAKLRLSRTYRQRLHARLGLTSS